MDAFRSPRLVTFVRWLVLVALAADSRTAVAKDPPVKPQKAAKGAATKAEVVARAMARLDEDVTVSERDMNEQHRIFTQSIAGLCFLLDPAAGKGAVHADRVDRMAESIGRYVDGAARHFEGAKKAADDEMAAMEWSQTTWSLGAAAIFYGECLARGVRRKDATARLRTIGDLLARSQQPDGGFGHDKDGRPRIPEIEMPMPGGGVKKMKYPNTLLSASNWAANALGICRAVSGKKLDAAITKAKAFYAASREGEGSYPYDPSQKGSGGGDLSAVARTAGSFVALRSMGLPGRDRDLARTGSFLARHVDDLPEGHGSSPHGVFFGAIATTMLGGEPRKEFEKTVVARIVAGQDAETGALDCICRHGGVTTCESFKSDDNFMLKMAGKDCLAWIRAYVTALNLFALVCEKGKMKLLDGLPEDDASAEPATTPSDGSDMGSDAPPAGPSTPAPPSTPPPPLPPTPTGPTFK